MRRRGSGTVVPYVGGRRRRGMGAVVPYGGMVRKLLNSPNPGIFF